MGSVVELLNRSPAEHERTSGPKYPIEAAMSSQRSKSIDGLYRRNNTTPTEVILGQLAEPPPRSDSNTTSANLTGEVQPSRQTSARNGSGLCLQSVVRLIPDTTKRKRLRVDMVEQSHRDSFASAGALSPEKRTSDSIYNFHLDASDGTNLGLLNTYVSIVLNKR